MPVRAFVVLLAAALLDFAVTGAHATPPVFHGDLAVRSAVGGFDKKIGIASLRVKNWDLVLAADSNGIQVRRYWAPDLRKRENRIIIAVLVKI